jgi:transposase-like protein
MPKQRSRVFSRAFKLAAVRRMMAGENVSALSRELQVLRKDLYYWRARFRAGGPEALRGRSSAHTAPGLKPAGMLRRLTMQRRASRRAMRLGRPGRGQMAERRKYGPREFDGRMIEPEEIEQIHRELLEFEQIEAVSDPMRALIEDLWPELVHKLPPRI